MTKDDSPSTEGVMVPRRPPVVIRLWPFVSARCLSVACVQSIILCDFVSPFPAIDHQILRSLLARRIADRQTMWLIDQILNSGAGILADECPSIYFPGDDLFAANRPRGQPQQQSTRQSKQQYWVSVCG